MKRKTDAAPIERYLSESERDRFRAAFCARTSDAASESAAPHRTRLTPAELNFHPPAIVQHLAAGNVVSLAAFRAAKEAKASHAGRGAGEAW